MGTETGPGSFQQLSQLSTSTKPSPVPSRTSTPMLLQAQFISRPSASASLSYVADELDAQQQNQQNQQQLQANSFGLGIGRGSQSRLQVVAADQTFTTELAHYMRKKWKLTDEGFNYNLISVLGSQSTGKSTLLNRLFGTQFPVMNESRRQQTTKGIWMSRAKDTNVLIMDVEGTDGRERGENQDFERKSALFSLATSEVLIVNMWEHMVGLYNSANMGLLKTVFEVNLQLFQRQGGARMLLLFIIRDHTGLTTLRDLADILQTDLTRIWDSLAKPAGQEDSRITDHFDFRFASLPHKILLPEKFESECNRLRIWFEDARHPEYVFKPQYHRRIPADGFPKYAETIWEKILTNRDLDLPTQQELLAQYRCDEISAAVFTVFQEASKHLRPVVVDAGKVVSDLGNQMRMLFGDALEQFDKSASRYVAAVYQRKRTEHMSKLSAHLHVLFMAQLRSLYKLATVNFTAALQAKVSSGSDYNFAAFTASVVDDTIHEFDQAAADMVLAVPSGDGISGGVMADWSFAHESDELRTELVSMTVKFRDEEIRKLHMRLERKIRHELDEAVSSAFGEPTPELWSSLLISFFSTTAKADQQLTQRLSEYSIASSDITVAVQRMHVEAWRILRKKIDDEMADGMVIMRLRGRLEERFRYDSNGLPRVWRPEDDIDAFFAEAKRDATQLLTLFERIDVSSRVIELGDGSNFFPASIESTPSGTGKGGVETSMAVDAETDADDDADFDIFATLVTIQPARKRELLRRFQRESDALYLEAKRSVVATEAKIPAWTLALILILGWNELLFVLATPVYLLLSLCLGGLWYIIHSLGLSDQVLAGVNMLVLSAVKSAQDKIGEVAASTAAVAAANNNNNNGNKRTNGYHSEYDTEVWSSNVDSPYSRRTSTYKMPGTGDDDYAMDNIKPTSIASDSTY
ncbi:root hair defective 3 GTP-binding protein [Ramicandelaber brevisporus]|nr:root hair defective 3 GTP-binding protein [Ramicandelaber brevisporus]